MSNRSMSNRRLQIALCLAAATAVAALGACRKEEQGRIRDFDPGVYKGQEDSQLDPAVVDDLRERARRQAGG
ncbi:MAG: hypothetical protein MI785_02100 [Kiloniellales bacterium]|nr:hypothetical protein [Kiloniellales bacterium]